jgi:hypothetical protein
MKFWIQVWDVQAENINTGFVLGLAVREVVQKHTGQGGQLWLGT